MTDGLTIALSRELRTLKRERVLLCQTLEEWRDDALYYKGLALRLDCKLKKLMGLDVKLKARKKRNG